MSDEPGLSMRRDIITKGPSGTLPVQSPDHHGPVLVSPLPVGEKAEGASV